MGFNAELGECVLFDRHFSGGYSVLVVPYFGATNRGPGNQSEGWDVLFNGEADTVFLSAYLFSCFPSGTLSTGGVVCTNIELCFPAW